MQRIINFFSWFSSWKTLLLFLPIYSIFPAYILKNAEAKINGLAGKEVGVIDLTVGFDPQKTLNMVEAYGSGARTYVAKVECTADLAYPIVYAFLFAIVLTLLFRKTRLAWLVIVPFITMTFDFLENFSIVTLLTTYPEQSTTWAALCEVFKLMKWITLGIVVLLIVYGLILKLTRRKVHVGGN